MIDQLITAFHSMEVTPLSATIKILISFALGAVIGIERQMRRQSAGMRTISLICIGATGAMLLSIWIPQSYPHFLNGDPGRIAAQIITGIGFLGAGAIIQSRGNVHGLTTAACIWVVSIVGMCVGAGMYLPATVLTFASLFVLIALERVEKKRMLFGQAKLLIITFATDATVADSVTALLRQNNIYLYDLSIEKDYEKRITILTLKVQVRPREELSDLFNQIKQLDKVSHLSLTSL